MPAAATEGTRTRDLYRALWSHAGGARGRLLLASAMLVASQLVRLLVPWLAAQAITTLQHATDQQTLRSCLPWVLAIVGIYVLAWSLHGPGRVIERSVAIRVRRSLADALQRRLGAAPLAWHEHHHSAEIAHRVTQASQALSNFAQSQFIYLQSAVNLVGPVIALWLISAPIGALAIGGLIGVALTIITFDRALMRLAHLENAAERRHAAALLDALTHVATVLSLRLTGPVRRLVASRLDAATEPLRKSMVVNEWKWCAVDLLGVTLSWSLVIVFAWRNARDGALLLSSLYMVHQYAQQAAGVAGSLASNLQSFARIGTDFASADPIWQAPRSEPPPALDVRRSWRTLELSGLRYVHAGPAVEAPATATAAGARDGVAPHEAAVASIADAALRDPLHDRIRDEEVLQDGVVPDGMVRDSTLGDLPRDSAPAPLDELAAPLPLADAREPRRAGLHDVALTLRAGERVALIGPSGCGKSTLLRVLAGLYEPQAGRIRVDGVETDGWRRVARRATLITQEPQVFESSVRENIGFERSGDDAALLAAARTATFDDVLRDLPRGLDAPIAQGGSNLSGGQRQRLCLARGVLAARGSALLLLDEPTSALDPLTELRVFDHLRREFADACLVASVHRMSLLARFDRIVLMEAGRVVDAGTREELLERQPLFREMTGGERAAAVPV